MKYTTPSEFTDFVFNEIKKICAELGRNFVECKIYIGHREYDLLARYAFDCSTLGGFCAIDLDNSKVFSHRFHRVLESSHFDIITLEK